MFKKILSFYLFLAPCFLYAQGENNNWTFGLLEGYNFNQGYPPQTIRTNTDGTSFFGGNASVSDPKGNLLFYTSGYAVVDNTHTTMPNGLLNGGLVPQGLLPHGEPGMQGVYIVPDIRDTNKYFIFTYINVPSSWIANPIPPMPTSKLFYSVVDMSLNNGKGDVVSNQKDILLTENVALGMDIVRAKSCGFWLVAHTNNQNPEYPNQYLAFKIDENGINTKPVISNGLLTAYRDAYSDVSSMKIAPDGKKIAAIRGGYHDTLYVQVFYDTSGAIIKEDSLSEPMLMLINKLEIGNFDAATGAVTSLEVLPDSLRRTYHPRTFPPYYDDMGCIEFSGNSKYLYVSQYKRSSRTVAGSVSTEDSTIVSQYDVTLNSINSIQRSKQFVYGNRWRTHFKVHTADNGWPWYEHHNNGLNPLCMRRTPDGEKILISDFDYFTHTDTIAQTYSFTNGINCIESINSSNPNFIEDYITRGDSVAIVSSIFSYDLGVNTLSRRDTLFDLTLDTITCNVVEASIPDGYHNPIWSDGDTNSKRGLVAGNTYWVQYENICHVKVDTFKIDVNLPPKPVINIDVFKLSTTQTYNSYQWLLNDAIIPDATQHSYTVTQNGKYRVIGGNKLGCVDTSDVYEVTNADPSAINYKDIKQEIHIYPNPAKDMIYVNAPLKINLKITGVEGKLIKEKANTSAISIAELAEGLYLLHITNENGTLLKIEKFIKAK